VVVRHIGRLTLLLLFWSAQRLVREFRKASSVVA
jgi:hypothetical protein